MDLEELSEADFFSLVPVIAKKNGCWLGLPIDAGLRVTRECRKSREASTARAS
jgi:hypothetical protein